MFAWLTWMISIQYMIKWLLANGSLQNVYVMEKLPRDHSLEYGPDGFDWTCPTSDMDYHHFAQLDRHELGYTVYHGIPINPSTQSDTCLNHTWP